MAGLMSKCRVWRSSRLQYCPLALVLLLITASLSAAQPGDDHLPARQLPEISWLQLDPDALLPAVEAYAELRDRFADRTVQGRIARALWPAYGLPPDTVGEQVPGGQVFSRHSVPVRLDTVASYHPLYAGVDHLFTDSAFAATVRALASLLEDRAGPSLSLLQRAYLQHECHVAYVQIVASRRVGLDPKARVLRWLLGQTIKRLAFTTQELAEIQRIGKAAQQRLMQADDDDQRLLTITARSFPRAHDHASSFTTGSQIHLAIPAEGTLSLSLLSAHHPPERARVRRAGDPSSPPAPQPDLPLLRGFHVENMVLFTDRMRPVLTDVPVVIRVIDFRADPEVLQERFALHVYDVDGSGEGLQQTTAPAAAESWTFLNLPNIPTATGHRVPLRESCRNCHRTPTSVLAAPRAGPYQMTYRLTEPWTDAVSRAVFESHLKQTAHYRQLDAIDSYVSREGLIRMLLADAEAGRRILPELFGIDQ